MRKTFKIVSIFIIGILLAGCEPAEQKERKEQLIQLAKTDANEYFSELTKQFKSDDYTINYLDHELLVDREGNKPIYKGDRIVFLSKDYPSTSGIRELVAEYDNNKLIALKITLDRNEGTLQEANEVSLSQQFITNYKLVSHAEYIETQVDNNISIVKFSSENETIIKIYVNNEINSVVGFMLYDGIDK